MRSFRKLTLVVLLALLAGTSWAAVYAYDKGFTKKWRRLVDNEFRKHGIEASIGKLTLDPFQGLVARNVNFYQDESRSSLLAAVSGITLDIDLIRLIDREFFLNTIDIANANVSLPVDPEDPLSDRLEIQNFSARLLMPGNRIEISQAHGNLQGIDVAIRASLVKSARRVESASASEPGGGASRTTLTLAKERRQALDRVVKELDKLAFPRDNRPRINIDLAGDLSDLANLRGEMNVSARNLRRGNYECIDLKADFEFANSRGVLKRLLLRDHKGELFAQAEHALGADRVPFKIQSTLDLHGLVSSASQNPSLGEIVFYDSPEIEVEGEILLDGAPITAKRLPLECVGSLRCGRFISRGVIFDGAQADFSVNRDRFYCRNIKLEHETGTLSANGLYDADGLRYDAVVRLDPRIAIPFAKSEGTRKFLSRCDFNENSTVYITLRGTGPVFKMSTWHSRGEIDVRNFSYRGTPFGHLQGEVEFDRRRQYFRNVQVKSDEGSAAAEFVSYDLDTGIATVKSAGGTIFPGPLTHCFSPGTAESLKAYRFSKPPAVGISGTIDTKARAATDFSVTFVADSRVDYDFLGKTLSFDRGEASLRFGAGRLSDAHIEGDVFDGKIVTDFSIDDLSGAKNYNARVDVESLSFRDLAARYGYHEDTEGELTGYFRFTGNGAGRRSIRGEGAGVIVNGDVFAIPVLGPLSKLVSGVFSRNRAGYSIAREASLHFTMHDGIIATEDFEALTNSFRLLGAGFVDTNRDTIRFDARLNARGPTGLLLLPVSKLLEYTCEGSLADPAWRPKILSAPAAAPSAPGGGSPASRKPNSVGPKGGL